MPVQAEFITYGAFSGGIGKRGGKFGAIVITNERHAHHNSESRSDNLSISVAVNFLSPKEFSPWTRYKPGGVSIAPIGVTRGAKTCMTLSAKALRPRRYGKILSATERRRARPDVGGKPQSICGELSDICGAFHPETSLPTAGTGRIIRSDVSAAVNRGTRKPACGACTKASTSSSSLVGRKVSSESRKQMISPQLAWNAARIASDCPPLS